MSNEKEKRNGRDGDLELRLQEVEFSPRNKVHELVGDLDKLVTDIKTLPLSAQLAVLRVVTPAVLNRVPPSARASVISGMKRGPSRH
ncbi:MAG: hypothetical protein WBV82_07810 [Myxococcaceae bacterium]